MAHLLRLIRVKQWVKNPFVFLPIFFTPSVWNFDNLLLATIAFCTLCVASSVTYILNDILDIEDDRAHPVKRNRPLASGAIKIPVAICLIFVFVALLLVMIFNNACVFIVFYLINTTIYSFIGKKFAIWDVFLIAAGFVIRTYFGAYVIGIDVTHWFLLTAMSVSVFLGCSKRFQEINVVGRSARKALDDYSRKSLDHMMMVSSCCAIVFYAQAAATKGEYMLFSTIFVMLGTIRFYVIMIGGDEDSPTDVLLGDKQLFIIGILWALTSIVGLTAVVQ